MSSRPQPFCNACACNTVQKEKVSSADAPTCQESVWKLDFGCSSARWWNVVGKGMKWREAKRGCTYGEGWSPLCTGDDKRALTGTGGGLGEENVWLLR